MNLEDDLKGIVVIGEHVSVFDETNELGASGT